MRIDLIETYRVFALLVNIYVPGRGLYIQYSINRYPGGGLYSAVPSNGIC
jgi:hypothetical protein